MPFAYAFTLLLPFAPSDSLLLTSRHTSPKIAKSKSKSKSNLPFFEKKRLKEKAKG
jgi:hypothetical protein